MSHDRVSVEHARWQPWTIGTCWFSWRGDGRRLQSPPSLQAIRRHAAENLSRLPGPLRRLQEDFDYRVEIAPALHELADQVDRNTFPATATKLKT